MLWRPPEGMDEYLKSTRQCDCDNEEIKRKAQALIKDAATPKEAAKNIFYFVRDEIAYALDVVDVKASHTLCTRRGDCILKTKLQIALLRAVGIPARYHRVGLRKELILGIFSGFVYRYIPEVVDYHPYCECYLSRKWIACEALFDKNLFSAMVEKGFPVVSKIPTIDWNGENDLIIVSPWVVKDFRTFDSLDDLWIEIAKRSGPKIVQHISMYFSNRHTNKIRKR